LPFGVAAPAAPESPAAKRLAAKDRSRAFPCMDKPCGCATAEQCFTNCCCNTPAETLAWAKVHAVEPAVLAALEQRVAGGGLSVTKAEKNSCCASKASAVEESCCTSKQPAIASVAENDCCGDARPLPAERVATAAPSADAVLPDHRSEVEPRTRTVTLRAMLACGGIVAEWFAAGAALPPPRAEVSLATGVLHLCTPGDESGECLRASPAAPPPRLA